MSDEPMPMPMPPPIAPEDERSSIFPSATGIVAPAAGGAEDRPRRPRLEWKQVVVDCTDPRRLGRWWAEALDWVVVNDGEEFEIRQASDRYPGLLFVRVPDPKTSKDRLHVDLRPIDQEEEVARLLALGATRADVGQGSPSWVVLRDPEGNEFCVLAARRT